MNELFNVTTNGDKLTLSARELHKELNVTDRFTRWFERMGEYGFEEKRGTEDRRMPARHSFADFLQITVDDDNGVVHNHSQRHNQSCQRHGVQLNAKSIEKSQ